MNSINCGVQPLICGVQPPFDCGVQPPLCGVQPPFGSAYITYLGLPIHFICGVQPPLKWLNGLFNRSLTNFRFLIDLKYLRSSTPCCGVQPPVAVFNPLSLRSSTPVRAEFNHYITQCSTPSKISVKLLRSHIYIGFRDYFFRTIKLF